MAAIGMISLPFRYFRNHGKLDCPRSDISAISNDGPAKTYQKPRSIRQIRHFRNHDRVQNPSTGHPWFLKCRICRISRVFFYVFAGSTSEMSGRKRLSPPMFPEISDLSDFSRFFAGPILEMSEASDRKRLPAPIIPEMADCQISRGNTAKHWRNQTNPTYAGTAEKGRSCNRY